MGWGRDTTKLIEAVQADRGRVIAFYNRRYVILDEPCNSTHVEDIFTGSTLIADDAVAPSSIASIFPSYEWVGHIWNAVMNDAQTEWHSKSEFANGTDEVEAFFAADGSDGGEEEEPTEPTEPAPEWLHDSCEAPAGTANMGDSVINDPPSATALLDDSGQPVTGGLDVSAFPGLNAFRSELLRLDQAVLIEQNPGAIHPQNLARGHALNIVTWPTDAHGAPTADSQDDLVRVASPDTECSVDPDFPVQAVPDPPERYNIAAVDSDCEARRTLDRGRFAYIYRHRPDFGPSIRSPWSQYEGGKTTVVIPMFAGTNDFSTITRRTRALAKAGLAPNGHLAMWGNGYVHPPVADIHILEIPFLPAVSRVYDAIEGTLGDFEDMDTDPGVTRLSILWKDLDHRAEDAIIAHFVSDGADFADFRASRCSLDPENDPQQACTVGYLEYILNSDTVIVNMQFDGHGAYEITMDPAEDTDNDDDFSGFSSLAETWSFSLNNPSFVLPAWTAKLALHEQTHGYGSLDERVTNGTPTGNCDDISGYLQRESSTTNVSVSTCTHDACIMHNHSTHWTSSFAATQYCDSSRRLVGIRDEELLSTAAPDCQHDPMDSISDVRMRRRPHFAVRIRWTPDGGVTSRIGVFLSRPFEDAETFLNSGLLAQGKVQNVEIFAVWPGYAYDCAVPDQDIASQQSQYEAYTINAIKTLSVQAVAAVPTDADSQLQLGIFNFIELPPVEGDDNYAYHKFGLALRYPQQVQPAAGQGQQTLSWTSNLKNLDADDLEVNAAMDNLNDSRTNQTQCLAGAAPLGSAAAPVLVADMEALLVEFNSGYIAFHTATGMVNWMTSHYGSYSAAPIVRLGWVFHQPQLDRLGLAFGVNLSWGD